MVKSNTCLSQHPHLMCHDTWSVKSWLSVQQKNISVFQVTINLEHVRQRVVQTRTKPFSLTGPGSDPQPGIKPGPHWWEADTLPSNHLNTPTTHLNNTCEVCTIFVSDYCIWLFHGHLLSVLVLLWEDSGTSVNVLRPCPLSPKQFATKQQQQQQQLMSYLLTAHQGPFAICRWCQQPLCYGLPLIWIFGTKQRPLSILMFHQCCSLNKTKRNISEGGEGGPEERHEGRWGPEKRRDREEGEVQTREEIYCRRGGGIEKRRHREVRGGPEKRRDRGDGRSREEKR